MDNNRTLIYENPSGKQIKLTSPEITRWFELRGRDGFTAPQMEITTQKYANGVTKILKRSIKPRTVSVSMVVIGNDRLERDRIFFDLVSGLMDVNGGNYGKLHVKRSDGMTVYLNCIYSSGLAITEEYKTLHRFTLEFYAPDPYFYRDLDDLRITANPDSFLTLNDNLLIGNHFRIGEFTSIGSGIITNNGQEFLQPVIRLHRVTGTVNIINEATGDSISMKNMAMTRGQTLVIDTRDESKNIYIENDDGTTIAAGQNMEWSNTSYEFPLMPGDNPISYNGGIGSRIEYLTFSMSERYLSA